MCFVKKKENRTKMLVEKTYKNEHICQKMECQKNHFQGDRQRAWPAK